MIIVLVIFILITGESFSQAEPDTIYRLKYKNSNEMVFGKGVNVRTYDVEFITYEGSIYVNKASVDYIKTPNGYILFEPVKPVSAIKEHTNKSWRVIISAVGHLNNTQKIFWGNFYDEREFEFHGAGSLEADFELFTGLDFQDIVDIKLGFGSEYVIPRTGESINGKVGFFNFFASGKFCVLKKELFSPSFRGRIGYGYIFGDGFYKQGNEFEGSKYFAVGGGLEVLNRIDLFCYYSFNRGYVLHPLQKIEIRFERLDVGIGVIF